LKEITHTTALTNTTLIDQLSSIEGLRNAWTLLKKENEDSFGISGTTIKKFSQELESNLSKISTELKKETFRFSPTRAAVIKKGNGKHRPLQIPEIKDRVVLKAMAILLEKELSGLLLNSEDVSFAYQQGRGVREAVLMMKARYLTNGKFILKADIINFFEEIQKNKLLYDLVYPNLKDKSINKLIADSMSQKLKGLSHFHKKHRQLFKNAGKGVPQGNPLSPLFSNIYLSKFDLQIKNLGYSLIRYADDFVVIFESEEEAKAGYQKIFELLQNEFALTIHPLGDENEKTTITNPSNKEFSFLSIRFDGKELYPGKETVGYLKAVIKKQLHNSNLDDPLFKDVYLAIEKWIALYSYLDIERYFDDIDNFLINQLSKKFGKKNYKPTKCKTLAQKRRTKQYNKNFKSLWRKADLISLLPKFIRPERRLNTAVAQQPAP
jgi:RNA-directed DNA polymerase